MRSLLAAAAVLALTGCGGAVAERPESPPPLPHVAAERPVMPAPALKRPNPHRPRMERPQPDRALDFGPEWARCDQYDALFVAASRRHLPWGAKGIGARWLKSQTIKESSCRPTARARTSTACGLMQTLAGTSRDLGITDCTDPAQSVEGGARYMAWQYGQWRAHGRTVLQRIRLALDGYYRGLGLVLADQRTYGCILWEPCFMEYAPPDAVAYVATISGRAGYPVTTAPRR